MKNYLQSFRTGMLFFWSFLPLLLWLVWLTYVMKAMIAEQDNPLNLTWTQFIPNFVGLAISLVPFWYINSKVLLERAELQSLIATTVNFTAPSRFDRESLSNWWLDNKVEVIALKAKHKKAMNNALHDMSVAVNKIFYPKDYVSMTHEKLAELSQKYVAAVEGNSAFNKLEDLIIYY